MPSGTDNKSTKNFVAKPNKLLYKKASNNNNVDLVFSFIKG